MKWQPIETAPKDGTPILLSVWEMGPDMSSAAWRNGFWDMRHLDDGDFDEWECLEREFGSPTHWMPLLAPPEAE